MRNNYFYKLLLIIVFSIFFINNSNSQDEFNFEVTEIEILNKGNLYKGLKRGTVKTNNGLNIKADNFTYNKITNIVEAEGKVKVEDVVNNYVIFSNKATYKKNEEIIFTEGNSKGIDDKNRTITSDKITYNKITNIVEAEGKVKVEDVVNNYVIFLTRQHTKKWEIIFTEGNSKGIDDKNRTITSDKITYNKITNIVEAEGKVKVEDVVNNYVIFSNKATYKKNEEIIFTEETQKE